MSTAQEERKPYKYVHTFETVTEEKPPEDVDRDALQTYINGLLGLQRKPT